MLQSTHRLARAAAAGITSLILAFAAHSQTAAASTSALATPPPRELWLEGGQARVAVTLPAGRNAAFVRGRTDAKTATVTWSHLQDGGSLQRMSRTFSTSFWPTAIVGGAADNELFVAGRSSTNETVFERWKLDVHRVDAL